MSKQIPTPSITAGHSQIPLDPKIFCSVIQRDPSLVMLWGETGVGKTTFAIQIAKYTIQERQKKVLYLNTKEVFVNNLVDRIIQGTERDPYDSLFTIFDEKKLKKQEKRVFTWLMQLQQYTELFSENGVGLIIIDEIMSSYLVEMRTLESSEKLNQIIRNIMSTLKKICLSYQIPILLINRFSIKENPENKSAQAQPYGGKLIDYWLDAEIQLKRSPTLQLIEFNLVQNRKKWNFPSSWKWKLGESGFNIR